MERLYTASALHAISSVEGLGRVLCSRKNHRSEKYYKFLALNGQQRFDKIKEVGVCF